MHQQDIPSGDLPKSLDCRDFPLSFLASTAGRGKGESKQNTEKEKSQEADLIGRDPNASPCLRLLWPPELDGEEGLASDARDPVRGPQCPTPNYGQTAKNPRSTSYYYRSGTSLPPSPAGEASGRAGGNEKTPKTLFTRESGEGGECSFQNLPAVMRPLCIFL
jgi:hypothetical protein